MKYLGMMNGWKQAPHCWKTFIALPIRIDRTPRWTSISLFGVVFFFDFKSCT